MEKRQREELPGLLSPIWQGVRLVGLAMAQRNFNLGMGCSAWADCTRCNQSIVAQFWGESESRAVPTPAIARVFRAHGWSIKPTLCPACREELGVTDGTDA